MKRAKNKKANILVVDDEKDLRDSMAMLLRDDYNVRLAESGEEALAIIQSQPLDLVLLDIRLPKIDGIEVLKLIKSYDESIEVIMVTAVIMVKNAVEAIRHGAYDYLTKPFDIEALQEQVAKVMEKRQLLRQNQGLRQLIGQDFQFEKIIGKSRAIRDVFKTIDAVAQSHATVMINGESGTGKELVAHAIHNRSSRHDKLFVAVNCAAIPENLLESELFGHERGSFTGASDRQIGKFEIANGGTLFLDEISSLPLAMQAKLLRAIQQREIERIGSGCTTPIDVRIISATNSDLPAAIKKHKFREDLFYRLNVIPIDIPPLRKRREDIPLLAHHFLHKYGREFNKQIKNISKTAMSLLIAYDWPGNIRELENLMERLVVLTGDHQITTQHLPMEMKGEFCKANNCWQPAQESDSNFLKAVQKFEAEFIRQALEKSGGKKTRAAKMLGIHRNTLTNLEKRLNLPN
ncbi:sigma-54-dependent Fis family transcriptional regulator [Candidatus Saganbacteria bacterium]|nr:sigma-54-dependent Fis family transcriptional regulator [Candidatus Saganbacteria bacterium]